MIKFLDRMNVSANNSYDGLNRNILLVLCNRRGWDRRQHTVGRFSLKSLSLSLLKSLLLTVDMQSLVSGLKPHTKGIFGQRHHWTKGISCKRSSLWMRGINMYIFILKFEYSTFMLWKTLAKDKKYKRNQRWRVISENRIGSIEIKRFVKSQYPPKERQLEWSWQGLS